MTKLDYRSIVIQRARAPPGKVTPVIRIREGMEYSGIFGHGL